MSARSEYDKWRASPALSDAERRELLDIADDAAEIESRFFAPLAFGTAGLRGVMALGTNRINVHVIRHATQAFAEVILEKLGGGEVAVCRDCRINSLLFAQEAASVLAGNGIRVRIFDDIRPTPELSFAIRKYGCAAGINITASHNTKEYNGYKVYLSDGAQLPPREARWVAERMEGTDIFASIKRVEYGDAVARGIITVMGEETDEAFLAEALGEAAEPQAVAAVADRLRVVYTPFHGAGYKLVPEALRRLGVRHLYPVPEQMTPDGTFPTVESPNPELPEGFALAGRLAREVGADIIIGTDPDSDRIAVLVRDGAKGGADNPDYVHLSGNKTGVLLIDYVLASKKRAGVLPENPVVLKTIVTTDMARRAARLGGARCFDTFTGFKFMAERKGELESSGEGNVVFSYEESYGYMAGDYVRDKDAVTAAVLITAMTAHYLARGRTLLHVLEELYAKLGHYGEETVSLIMPGIDGLRDMRALMAALRDTPPGEIAGTAVVSRRDYLPGIEYGADGERELRLRGSDVLCFHLDDGTEIFIRPSGTEPKIKIYVLAKGADAAECSEKTRKYAAWAAALSEPKPG